MFIDDLLRLLSTPRVQTIFVCELERYVYIRMGACLGRVYLSKETVIKQASRHPEIKSEEYRMLPDAIMGGLVIHDLKQPHNTNLR